MHMYNIVIKVTLLAAVFVSGCSEPIIIPSKYSPKFSGNLPLLNGSVIIRDIKDNRFMKEDEYFHDKDDMMHGCFDRPIRAIVKEALIYEFDRAGLKALEPSMPYDSNPLVLECNIENFEVKCEKGPENEAVMNASVTLVFEWLDIETDALVSVKRRSETSTTRRSGIKTFLDSYDDVNMFIKEDKTDILTQGSKLIEELLPIVIQEELRQSDYLKKTAEKN